MTADFPWRIHFLGGNPLHLAMAKGLGQVLMARDGMAVGRFFTLGLSHGRPYFEAAAPSCPFAFMELPAILESWRSLPALFSSRARLERMVRSAMTGDPARNVLVVATEWGAAVRAFIAYWRRAGGRVILLDEWSLFPYTQSHGTLDVRRTKRLAVLSWWLNRKSPSAKSFTFFGLPSDCHVIEDAAFDGALMIRPAGFSTGRGMPTRYILPPLATPVRNDFRLVIYGTVDHQFGVMRRKDWDEVVWRIVTEFRARCGPEGICYKLHPLEVDEGILPRLADSGITLDRTTPGEDLVLANPKALHVACSSTVVGLAAMLGYRAIALYPLVLNKPDKVLVFDLFYNGSGLTITRTLEELMGVLSQSDVDPSVGSSPCDDAADALLDLLGSLPARATMRAGR